MVAEDDDDDDDRFFAALQQDYDCNRFVNSEEQWTFKKQMLQK